MNTTFREDDATKFRHVGPGICIVCRVMGPSEDHPGNRDPLEGLGRIGLWPSFYTDAMDPETSILWGHCPDETPLGTGTKHHLRLNNTHCLASIDHEGTPTIQGWLSHEAMGEETDGYPDYKDSKYAVVYEGDKA
jgi:hypothetical protein